MGGRNRHADVTFMCDLASRLSGPTRLSTDGLWVYPEAVLATFGRSVDYGQIVKLYGRGLGDRRGQAEVFA